MSLDINLGAISGNLTQDPELEIIPDSSNVVLNMSIGFTHSYDVNDRKKNYKQKRSCFVNCRCWKGTAEAAVKNLTKGDEIHIEYKLIVESWTDKATQKRRYKTVLEITPYGLTYVRCKKLGIGFDDPSKRGRYAQDEQDDSGQDSFPTT